jgi:hypothetical protein
MVLACGKETPWDCCSLRSPCKGHSNRSLRWTWRDPWHTLTTISWKVPWSHYAGLPRPRRPCRAPRPPSPARQMRSILRRHLGCGLCRRPARRSPCPSGHAPLAAGSPVSIPEYQATQADHCADRACSLMDDLQSLPVQGVVHDHR